MKNFNCRVLVILSFFMLFWVEAQGQEQELQTINPRLDMGFIESLGLFNAEFDSTPKHFNILIVGQDQIERNRRRSGQRDLLGSRADIIMVLSINTAYDPFDSTGFPPATVSSFYRGNLLSRGCEQGLGRRRIEGEMLKGVYRTEGRSGFISCVEGTITERSLNSPFEYLLEENGSFRIHAFFEGNKVGTIHRVMRDSLSVVRNEWSDFFWVYGRASLLPVINFLTSGGTSFQEALFEQEPTPEDEEAAAMIDLEELEKFMQKNGSDDAAQRLTREILERNRHLAGGYQRAFNFTTAITNAIGWSAFGLDKTAEDEPSFLSRHFGEVILNNFSASHELRDLEQSVLIDESGRHVLRNLCYRNGHSPVRVIQWGPSGSNYLTYENGAFDKRNTRGGILSRTEFQRFLPTPPNCSR